MYSGGRRDAGRAYGGLMGTMYEKLFGNVMALNRYLRMQYILPVVGQVADAVVLDLGCLDGHFTQYLTGRGNCVHAVDIRDYGIRRALPTVRFCRGSGARLPYADASFDFLFCSDVVEHVPRYEEFIPEISRVLKPGGTCLLSTVDGYWHSPVRLRAWFRRHLPAAWHQKLLGRFAVSDEDLHRDFMGHVRYDLTMARVTDDFARGGLTVVAQCAYCRAAGSLLVELFFSFNESIRYWIFPLLRALLPLDRWLAAGKPWQYYLLLRKNA